MVLRSTKIRVSFQGIPQLDFGEMVFQLSQAYDLGYVGSHTCDGSLVLFLQTSSSDVRMVDTKIKKVCGNMADVQQVSSFTVLPLQVTCVFGEIRHTGRVRAKTTKDMVKTFKKKNLQINTFGEEDTSHITTEMLSEIVGTEEEALQETREYFEDNQINGQKYTVLRLRWMTLRERQKNAVPPTTKEYLQYSDFDLHQFVQDHSPVYDEDSDSEQNLQLQNVIEKEYLLRKNVLRRYVDIVSEFEKLLYQNPANLNVKASLKQGYFECFENECWVSKLNDEYFHTVIRNSVFQMTEVAKSLDLSPFVKSQLEGMSLAFSEVDNKEIIWRAVVKTSILNNQNQRRIFRESMR